MSKKIILKLKRSLIGCTQRQKDTVRCLGLRRTGSEVEVSDVPAVRGQVYSVQHLLEVKIKR